MYLPSNWNRESLETIRNQLIYQGAQLIPKGNKHWTVVMNRQYKYIREARFIYAKVKQMAYFVNYAITLYQHITSQN